MKAQVLTGSKNEIAETLAHINGKIHEAIIFVEEPVDPVATTTEEDIFAEMDSYTVQVGGADYSRESLYTRMEGE